MCAIWRQQDDEWQELPPAGFPSEGKLHDLVAASPNLLPLSGEPSLAVLGREVPLGAGVADLVAVESDGRLVIIEIKLRRNAEARRAVVAQILTYAAHLKGLETEDLEAILRRHLLDADSIIEAARQRDQSGEFDERVFADGLAESLRAGSFRLVLVLDEAPSELVQLVGYLESITSGIALDLVTVSAYEAGSEQLLVPQRVDPDYQAEQTAVDPRRAARASKPRREVDGADAFEQAIEHAANNDRPTLRRLLAWARELESQNLVELRTVLGEGRQVLTVWVPGAKGGLASIWNDNGAYLPLWRSVFVRLAWNHIAPIEEATGKPMGQGTSLVDPSDEVLDLLTRAYREAVTGTQSWNGRDFYVAFGENEQRSWDDAAELGFVSAGGGEWYSRTLKQLEPGHRIFAYIPKGSGVGGYVGAGEVTGQATMAKDFVVQRNGEAVPYLDTTRAPEAGQHSDDPALAEWVVPVRWLATRSREEAEKDRDFFANQNSAVKLTHGYTIERLTRAFGFEDEKEQLLSYEGVGDGPRDLGERAEEYLAGPANASERNS